MSLHEIPQFLQHSFILAEDRRFYRHQGVDWKARLAGLVQNLRAGRVVRGASTISEQVVRMLHPRPRSLWARWLEGFEAGRLEQRFSKPEILEFYLNQVPYRAQRRGVRQAALYYFDRDLSTLSNKEMLALSVLVRSPQWLDPQNHPERLHQVIAQLVDRLDITAEQKQSLKQQSMTVRSAGIDYDLSHFIAFADARQRVQASGDGRVNTTLDLELQIKAQRILDSNLDRFAPRQVANGATLVIDHQRNEILSWVVGHADRSAYASNRIDAVNALRQPGSTLKPFVYALAVAPAYQRQGVASRLVAELETALTRQGCLKINLQVRASNERVIAFYEKLGYAVEDRVSMGKRTYE